VTTDIDPIDPVAGIEDELRRYDVEEVIVATHPPQRANWVETTILGRMRHELSVPVTQVVIDDGPGPNGEESHRHSRAGRSATG
jgi:hypothetical protein